VLVIDRVVRPHELERRLMVKVLPLPPHRLMCLGENADSLAPAMAPALATTDTSLAFGEIHFCLAVAGWRADAHAVRKRGERLNTEVYPGLLSSGRERLHWHIRAGEGRVPAVGLVRDRDRLGRAFDGSAPMDTDTPDLGQNEKAVVQPRAVAILLVGEGVVAVPALESWEARFLAPLDATDEGLMRLVQPREYVLQDVGVDGRVLQHRGADVFQFGFLLIA